MGNEDTRIQDPSIAAEEAWEVHDRAEMMMNLGQESPNAKQLDAASLSIEDHQNIIAEYKKGVAEVHEHLGRFEQSVDAMQVLTEHITGEKFPETKNNAIDHIVKPMSEYPLPVEYRDTSNLRAEGEIGIYVDRLQTGVSNDGEILNAEDILDSTVIILMNKETGQSYLAVIDDTLTGEQSLKMRELSEGKYDLLVVVGKGSRQNLVGVTNRSSSVMEAFEASANNKLEMSKSIDVDYGGRGWCIAFDPKKKTVKVFTKSDRMVKEYKI